MSREATKKQEAQAQQATPTPLVWEPTPDVRPEPDERHRPARRLVLWASVTVLLLGGGAAAVYELEFQGRGAAAADPAGNARHVGVVTTPDTALPTASTLSPSPQPAGTSEAPVAAPTMTVANHPVPVTTPAAQAGESAVHVSGAIQCQSKGVEGVWIQAVNGGSGWAPWVSSAADPSHATYSYTLSHGGQYSVEIGCGGTPGAWSVVEYSSFHGGAVNDFYCYDETNSSLYSYCRQSS